MSPDEIKDLIMHLKPGKVAGLDAIPPETLKLVPDWWAIPLASVFIIIDRTGMIPEFWLNTVVVPVYIKR